MQIPTMITPRLTLRPFRLDDVGRLHQILSDREVVRYFPKTDPPSREQVRKFIEFQLSHWEKHAFGWWAIEPQGKGELIGWSGLQCLPETEEVEVAYLLGKAFWGNGFATEAAKASLQFGVEQLDRDTIVGIVHPENLASQQVLEKLGMKLANQANYFGMDCFRYTMKLSTYAQQTQRTT